MGKVVIHGGRHANRRIMFRDDTNIRPTGSRVREILMNWLRPHIQGLDCLDIFAGSGVLAFEVMSQGARSVVCIDHSPQNCQQIMHEAKRIGEPGISTKCISFPGEVSGEYDLVLMDPPFDQPTLLHPSLQKTLRFLKKGGLVYIESQMQLEVIEGYTSVKMKKVGRVWMYLWRREQENE